MVDVGPALGLPPLPTLSLVLHTALLHTTLRDPGSRDALRAITAAFRTPGPRA